MDQRIHERVPSCVSCGKHAGGGSGNSCNVWLLWSVMSSGVISVVCVCSHLRIESIRHRLFYLDPWAAARWDVFVIVVRAVVSAAGRGCNNGRSGNDDDLGW